jgi:hypothetical protein
MRDKTADRIGIGRDGQTIRIDNGRKWVNVIRLSGHHPEELDHHRDGQIELSVGKVYSGAHATAGTKGVVSLVGIAAIIRPVVVPFGSKGGSVGVAGFIVVDGPRVEEDGRVFRDDDPVPADVPDCVPR